MYNLTIKCRIALVVTLTVITYLSTTEIDHSAIQSMNDKFNHVVAFYIVSFFVDFSFPKTKFNWLKATSIFAYGMAIEVIQSYLPFRMFSVLDLFANALGIVVFLLSGPLLKKVELLQPRWEVYRS